MTGISPIKPSVASLQQYRFFKQIINTFTRQLRLREPTWVTADRGTVSVPCWGSGNNRFFTEEQYDLLRQAENVAMQLFSDYQHPLIIDLWEPNSQTDDRTALANTLINWSDKMLPFRYNAATHAVFLLSNLASPRYRFAPRQLSKTALFQMLKHFSNRLTLLSRETASMQVPSEGQIEKITVDIAEIIA